jgi:hypothetical protein
MKNTRKVLFFYHQYTTKSQKLRVFLEYRKQPPHAPQNQKNKRKKNPKAHIRTHMLRQSLWSYTTPQSYYK